MRFVFEYILLFYSVISVVCVVAAIAGKQINDTGMMIDNCRFL